MRPHLVTCLVVVVVSSAFLSAPLESKEPEFALPSDDYPWIKVETPNFTVFSNADEEIARANAQSLELLWAVLARHFDRVPAMSPVPNSVFVFDLFSDTFVPYGPFTKKGRPMRSGGYLISRPTANYVAIVERDYRYPNRLDLYHEYVHTALDSFLPELPPWLEEGLAEYYSVLHIKEGKAYLGYRINGHIARLRNRPLIPLAELFAIDRGSAEVNDDDRTGMFYAESWLLTHLLLTERPNGRAQAMLYADLLRQGVGRDAAFEQAFQTTYDKLEAELKKYVRARSHHYKVFPLSTEIIGKAAVSEMTRAEVLSRLGDLLVNGTEDRLDFAAMHFSAALEIDDAFGPAAAGLGQLEEAAGRKEAALAMYERAAGLTPGDERINLLLGRALLDLTAGESCDETRVDSLKRARAALHRATGLRPELVEPWAALGASYLSESDGVEGGIEALERAMRLQPKRPDIGINLATLYVMQGSLTEAESVIERMAVAGVDEETLARTREIVALHDSNEPRADAHDGGSKASSSCESSISTTGS